MICYVLRSLVIFATSNSLNDPELGAQAVVLVVSACRVSLKFHSSDDKVRVKENQGVWYYPSSCRAFAFKLHQPLSSLVVLVLGLTSYHKT